MFLDYFRLREQPFGVTPDPRFLFPSHGHREALASLIYGVESNLGFGALIAAPGMGKTTLLFHILEQYRATARTAFIFNTQCNSNELLRSLLSELDDDASAMDSFQSHEKFKQILAKEAADGKRVIVVIDEAQNLGDLVMETVRLLSNFESANFKMLHIILAGQAELAEKLAKPELNQLQQRIPILTQLPHLSPQDVNSYIEHRLRVAGYQGKSLFTPEAIRQIVWLSRGVPRQINRICFNCLSLTYASSKPVVDLPVVEEVAMDLDLKAQSEKKEEVKDQYGATGTGGFAPRTVAAWQAPARPVRVSKPVQAPPSNMSKQSPAFGAMPSAVMERSSQQWVPRAPRRPMRIASRLPAISRDRRPSQAWRSFARPLSFALFYLSLVGAGWIAFTHWIHPSFFGAEAQSAGVTDSNIASPDRTEARAEQESAAPSRNAASAPKPARKGEQTTKAAARAGRDSIRLPEPETLQSTVVPTPVSAKDPSQPATYRGRPQRSNAMSATARKLSGPPVTRPSVSTGAQPELVRFVKPRYPEAARNQHIEGTVVLSAVVSKDGSVRGLRPVSGHPLLLEAAETAVRDWIYRPYQINGKPVDVDTEIVISFSLPKDHTP